MGPISRPLCQLNFQEKQHNLIVTETGAFQAQGSLTIQPCLLIIHLKIILVLAGHIFIKSGDQAHRNVEMFEKCLQVVLI